MNEYVSGKQAQEILGVHQQTLYNWDKKKLIETIRTPGGKRLYNVKKYSNGKIIILENKINKDVKEELVDDVLQIMNIFVAKINGLRKYKKI